MKTEPSLGAEWDSDDHLAVRAAGGDSEAFGQIYDRYAIRIGGLLRTYARDHAELEDLVHETFYRVMDSLSSYRPKGLFRAWIFKVALNVGRREARRRKVVNLCDMEADEGNKGGTEAQPMEEEETRQLGETLLRSLAEPKRLVVILRVWLEFSYDEISLFLGIPPGTARRRMHTALKELRQALCGSENRREVVTHDIDRSQSSGR